MGKGHLPEVLAYRWLLEGHVQGVGFRPFVYRLALTHGLAGTVRNCMGQVEINAQGTSDQLHGFAKALIQQAPQIARPVLVSRTEIKPVESSVFHILPSESGGESIIHVPPDYFTCSDCLADLENPEDRRFGYPFINCTQCGPRYTLIRALPYDRPNTTMAGFPLCADCEQEYTNPTDRRFHAEPIACPVCGPQLRFSSQSGQATEEGSQALSLALAVLRSGEILAVKGIGGYHLMCDANNDVAVGLLRERKPRPDKPLAVMFPAPTAAPLSMVGKQVELPAAAQDQLLDSSRPIVLCRRKADAELSSLIAPGLEEVGTMLPYSPLHHLLLSEFAGPLVATSGNISGEPVITDNAMAEERLGHIAVAFLHHDRPIQRPADDSVFRIIRDRAAPMRLGRGTAPLEIKLPFELPCPVLAVGGHMKNTLALAWGKRAVVSPHIGELGSLRSRLVFEQVIVDMQDLYGVRAQQLICDVHPGYASSRWARENGLPLHKVFHHRAHASALAAETRLQDNALVFTWDGVGYGEDGSLWGGEALSGSPGNWQRYASFKPFHLPGGDKAGREPWRSAAALTWGLSKSGSDPNLDNSVLYRAWKQGVNSPATTAAGRLFDAAAALTGLCTHASFEGQGPMLLEAACEGKAEAIALPRSKDAAGYWVCDWSPLVPMLQDTRLSVAERAVIFHESMAQVILGLARQAQQELGTQQVGLAGGVFQNRILTERALSLLQADGFECVFGKTIPVNDGGLCIGQVLEYGYTKTTH